MQTRNVILDQNILLKYPFICRLAERPFRSFKVSTAYDATDLEWLMKQHASVTHHARLRYDCVTSVSITLLASSCRTLRVLSPKVETPWLSESPNLGSEEEIETVGDAFAAIPETVAYVFTLITVASSSPEGVCGEGWSRWRYAHLSDLTDCTA